MKSALTSLLLATALMASNIPAATAQETAADKAHGDRHEGRGHGERRGGMDRSFRNPEKFAERLQQHLELSDLQRQSISNILLAAKPEAEALRQAARSNREAMRALDTAASDYASRVESLSAERGQLAADRAALHGRVRASIDAELTPEQREKMAEAKSRRHERRGGKHRRDGKEDT
jgi:Spy/CpxP family protein refolding chaperone